jgi:hypothetical protein
MVLSLIYDNIFLFPINHLHLKPRVVSLFPDDSPRRVTVFAIRFPA